MLILWVSSNIYIDCLILFISFLCESTMSIIIDLVLVPAGHGGTVEVKRSICLYVRREGQSISKLLGYQSNVTI